MVKADYPKKPKRADYEADLYALQVELAKFHNWQKQNGLRLAVVFEGRDTAGKGGAIKRILMHLPPRTARSVALPKPSDRDRASWYFQRYVAQLPVDGELVLFDRSWYNRAGVEPVMGFCKPGQYHAFMREAPKFEEMLEDADVHLIKYYLDIDREEQAKRLAARRTDPLKHWKISPIDEVAQEKWDDYTRMRNAILERTSHREGIWNVVRANEKRHARLNILRDILSRYPYDDKDEAVTQPDPRVVFAFERAALTDGRLAR